MSWLFSRALVEASWQAKPLVGEQCAPSNATPTPQAYWWPDKTTEAFPRFPSGMTCEPLPVEIGQVLSMWSAEDSPAKTSVPQVVAPAWQENAAACGPRWLGWWAKYDPGSSSWKTPQCSLLEDLEPFLATWPDWGLMRDGVFWGLPMPDYLTPADASGLWPTPVKFDAKMALMMPKNGDSTRLDKHGKQRKVLRDGRTASMGLSRLIISMIGKLPKVEAFEEMMGWPSGWTALKPLATGRRRKQQQQHGES